MVSENEKLGNLRSTHSFRAFADAMLAEVGGISQESQSEN
jgi:hypothetical protein